MTRTKKLYDNYPTNKIEISSENPAIGYIEKRITIFTQKLIKLSNDLIIGAFKQKLWDKLTTSKGVLGNCITIPERTSNGGPLFLICLNSSLRSDTFLKTLLIELNHYSIEHIVLPIIDPEITGQYPPLNNFVSEMLGHNVCHNCENFCKLTCLKHPDSFFFKFHSQICENQHPLQNLSDSEAEEVTKKILKAILECPDQTPDLSDSLIKLKAQGWPIPIIDGLKEE